MGKTTNFGGGCSEFFLFYAFLIGLKAAGILSWSWLAILLSPIWIPLLLLISLAVLLLFIFMGAFVFMIIMDKIYS
jgi:hypothetical protein